MENEQHSTGCPDLAGHDRLQSVVRDRVLAVAEGHAHGLYVCGRAGTGKTYTIRRTLDEHGKQYQYCSGHLTPMGLFDLLATYPDYTIVLDDVSEVLGQKTAVQLLLAALGNQPSDTGVRRVRYCRQGEDIDALFSGGIILISNLQLRTTPVLQPLRSRVHCLSYEPSDDQIVALMRHVASKGCQRLQMSPLDCEQVAAFVIAESQRLGVRLDLRHLLDKAYSDFAFHRDGHASNHWTTLVTTTLQETLVNLDELPSQGPTRVEIKEDEQQLAKRIAEQFATPKERVAAWHEQTGKGYRSFYRRCDEAGL